MTLVTSTSSFCGCSLFWRKFEGANKNGTSAGNLLKCAPWQEYLTPPKVARRREREKRTISNMVAIYCAGNHEATARTETSHAGEALCPACKAIDDYCVLRTERCRSMAHKTSCEECGNHCYAPAQREQIRAIMRYAGPRMITRHPIAAIRHLLKK